MNSIGLAGCHAAWPLATPSRTEGGRGEFCHETSSPPSIDLVFCSYGASAYCILGKLRHGNSALFASAQFRRRQIRKPEQRWCIAVGGAPNAPGVCENLIGNPIVSPCRVEWSTSAISPYLRLRVGEACSMSLTGPQGRPPPQAPPAVFGGFGLEALGQHRFNSFNSHAVGAGDEPRILRQFRRRHFRRAHPVFWLAPPTTIHLSDVSNAW